MNQSSNNPMFGQSTATATAMAIPNSNNSDSSQPINISFSRGNSVYQNPRLRRESIAHSQGMGGISWGSVTIGSWLKDEVMLHNQQQQLQFINNNSSNTNLHQQQHLPHQHLSPFFSATSNNSVNINPHLMSHNGSISNNLFRTDSVSLGISPALNNSSYLADLEANYCKDYSCCGQLLPTLHDLLRHYEEMHIQPEPTLEAPRARQINNNTMDTVSTNEVFLTPQSNTQHQQQLQQQQAQQQLQQQATMRNQVNNGVQQQSNINLNNFSFNQQSSNNVNQQQSQQQLQQQQAQARAQAQAQVQAQAQAQAQAQQQQQQYGNNNNSQFSQRQPFQQASQFNQSNQQTPQVSRLFQNVGQQQQRQQTQSPLSNINNTQQQQSHPDIIPHPTNSNQQSNPSASNNGNNGSRSPQHQFPMDEDEDMDEDEEICIDDPARHLYVMEHGENRPFKCPVIGCDKNYKNQNGLKYHRLHGHQNQTLRLNQDGTFSVIDPESDAPYPDGMGMEKDKPYRCEVCGKRYKNLNGLKYHRGHSTH